MIFHGLVAMETAHIAQTLRTTNRVARHLRPRRTKVIEEAIKEALCKEHGLNPEQVTVKITPEGVEVIVNSLPLEDYMKIVTATEKRDMT